MVLIPKGTHNESTSRAALPGLSLEPPLPLPTFRCSSAVLQSMAEEMHMAPSPVASQSLKVAVTVMWLICFLN